MVVFAEVNYPVNHPKDRFTGSLDAIERKLVELQTYGDLDSKISYLDSSGIREYLTELQNLVRLYSKSNRFSGLKPFYEPIKDFEDHISHLRDLKYNVSSAGYYGAQIQQYWTERLNENQWAFHQLLKSNDWSNSEESIPKRIRKSLESINWPSLKKDRNYLLGRLSKYFQKLQEEDYNLNLVEEGLHELRRDARRLSYFNNVINQLVVADYSKACPIGRDIPPVEPSNSKKYSCKVSGCLLDKLSHVNSQMASFRSDTLVYLIKLEAVPQTYVERAAAIQKDLLDSKVLLHLSQQIRSCQTSREKEHDHVP